MDEAASARILLLRPGAIGDTLITYPTLLALRARHPTATVHFVANTVALPLLVSQRIGGDRPLIDRATAFDDAAVTGLFLPAGPTEATRAAFGRIDAAVAWCADPKGILAANLRWLGADEVVVAPSRSAPDRGVHVAAHLVSALARLGAPPGLVSERPLLSVDPAWSRAADEELARLGLAKRPFLVVHPGSGSVGKNWPAERFATILDQVPRELGLHGIILGGPAEDQALARLGAALARPVPVARHLPLPTVAGIVRRARAYLGNDSGLTHLAGLLGVPTLAIFGPTDPVQWAPLGPRVRILRHQPIDALAGADVLTALVKLVAETGDRGDAGGIDR